MKLNLGIIKKDGKVINHRSLLKIIFNPLLRLFGWQIATNFNNEKIGVIVLVKCSRVWINSLPTTKTAPRVTESVEVPPPSLPEPHHNRAGVDVGELLKGSAGTQAALISAVGPSNLHDGASHDAVLVTLFGDVATNYVLMRQFQEQIIVERKRIFI